LPDRSGVMFGGEKWDISVDTEGQAPGQYADTHAGAARHYRLSKRGPLAGTHADLKVVDGMSNCFKDIRQREQSEWEAANPVREELQADATKLEKISAEHLRLMREIRRLTKNDRFTGYCCFELANRPIEVMDSFKEVLPSLSNGRIDRIQVRCRYSRDNIWMNASVCFGSKRVGVLVEGTNPSWVEAAANLLEKNLRVRRPHWAPLVSGWGYWLSQVAFGGLVAAIVPMHQRRRRQGQLT